MMALPECYLFAFITNFLLQNTKDPQNLHFGKSFRKFSKCLFNNNLKVFLKGMYYTPSKIIDFLR